MIGVKYNRHVGRRDRERSRIPAKKSRLWNKRRKLRKQIRKHIKSNVPRSSHIHRLLCAFSHERKKLLSYQVRYLPQVVNYKELKGLHKNLKRRRKQTGQKTTVFFSKNINKETLNKAYTKSH